MSGYTHASTYISVFSGLVNSGHMLKFINKCEGEYKKVSGVVLAVMPLLYLFTW